MSENTTETVEAEVIETVEVKTYTPYGAAKVVNQWLQDGGFAKVLPAQMFYNYTRGQLKAGKKPMIPCDTDGRIGHDDLEAWYTKYAAKNLQTK
jgi:hypothetical protein